jgi:DNA-binding transcriptional regulator YdaS (Cro superfamily)
MPNLGAMEMSEIIRRGGGMSKLAKAVGLHRASRWYWTRVPPQHVKAVAAATGIPAHELRPDLWDAPDTTSSSTKGSPKSKPKRSRDPASSDTPSSSSARAA